MGSDAAAMFASGFGSVGTYFGIQPNSPANIGQRAVFSHIGVTSGTNVIVDEHFAVAYPYTEVDTSAWTPELDGGTAVGSLKVLDQLPADWISWKLPDPKLAGLQISSNLLSGWIDPGLPLRSAGPIHEMLALPDLLTNYPDAAYFRLYSTNSP
jgi:hypothetical protein